MNVLRATASYYCTRILLLRLNHLFNDKHDLLIRLFKPYPVENVCAIRVIFVEEQI